MTSNQDLPDFNFAKVTSEFNSFAWPIIGLDGGVSLNIKGKSIPKELEEYLLSRSVKTGKIFGSKYNAKKDEIIPVIDETNSWLSTRSEKYFYVNMKFAKDPSAKARKESLRTNLIEDSNLLEKWGKIEKSLKDFDDEFNWRVNAALWVLIANDLVSVDYYTRVLEKFLPVRANGELFKKTRDNIFEVFTLYYSHLLGFKNVGSNKPLLLALLKDSIEILEIDDSQLPEELDPLRSARETDMSYITLGGAKMFTEEFKGRKINVIIPIFGAYDLGPALRACGFDGEIAYVIPKYKLNFNVKVQGDIANRQASQIQNVVDQLQKDFSKDNVGVFDDTFASGETIESMYSSLINNGFKVISLRTLFVNSTHKNFWNFYPKYKHILKGYFHFPFVSMEKTGLKDFFFTTMYSSFWKQNPELKEEKRIFGTVVSETVRKFVSPRASDKE